MLFLLIPLVWLAAAVLAVAACRAAAFADREGREPMLGRLDASAGASQPETARVHEPVAPAPRLRRPGPALEPGPIARTHG